MIGITALIAAALVAAVFAFGRTAVDANPADLWPDLSVEFDPRDLQTGDLVFRRGRDSIADAVMTYGEGSRYSHVGAVVMRDGVARVIHAVPKEGESPGGVIDEAFAEFGAPRAAAAIGVYRLSEITEQQTQAILKYLEAEIGKPFDLSLRASDDREHYCTELVVRALRAADLLGDAELRTVDSGLMPEPVIPPEALIELSGVEGVKSLGG